MNYRLSGQLLVSPLVFAVCFGAAQGSRADYGQPVAVCWWEGLGATIEPFWNHAVAIDLPDGRGQDAAGSNVALVLRSSANGATTDVGDIRVAPVTLHGVSAAGEPIEVAGVLDRLPNVSNPTWTDVTALENRSSNSVSVTSVSAWTGDEDDRDSAATTIFRIEVDGVRIAHCGRCGQTTLGNNQLERLRDLDVLLLAVGSKLTAPQAARIVRQSRARVVVPIGFQLGQPGHEFDEVQPFLDELADDFDIVKVAGNTLAISARGQVSGSRPRVVLLRNEPWTPRDELGELLSRKEQACRQSQAVFAKLSSRQLNFRPANGTHTPRWNSEHMAGRELLFFSQIYAAQDEAIRVEDLNPAQMPPDYVPAHPDWDGAEEARHMERVNAYTRRFAYLLDGLDLDRRAPGSFWTPRRLLEQMIRHYSEHTANVEKKFALPDWPADE